MNMNRRSFVQKGLLGGALLTLGGGGFLALRRGPMAYSPATELKFLSLAEFNVFAAFADRIIPGGENHVVASALQVAEKADAVMWRAEPGSQAEFKQLLGLFENALPGLLLDGHGRPFTALAPLDQDRVIDRWRRSGITLRRSGYQALKRLACACYYGSPETHAGLGYHGPVQTIELAPVDDVAAVEEVSP